MKLLLFSDLHKDRDAAERLVRRAPDFDVLVGAGDFASGRHGVSICIDVLKAVDKPVVLVAGNNESTDELREACRGWKSAHVLHGSGVTIDGQPFFGLPGGVPVTPFGAWSYDFTEEEAGEMLAACPAGSVLVTHSPPKGAADERSPGKSSGSTAVREAILRIEPKLVVCGHIHANWGVRAMVGSTPVVNAGPGGAEWHL